MSLKVYSKGNPQNPAILFLHAFPFSSAMWKEQIDVFSENFYCVFPDLPGFGESPLPDHSVTFEHFADVILKYLKDTKVENAFWCGLSMGGYLALRMYEREPQLCRGLVLCDTKAGADGNEAKVKRWASIQALQKNRDEFIAAQWQALVGESSKGNAALKTRFMELIAKTTDRGICSGLVAMATRTDSTSLLPKISVPTLIVVGEEDKVTPLSESEAMQKAIPGSTLRTISKSGHLSNLESPEAFNEALRVFCSR